MAKHKAPTQVTLASLQQQQTFFHEFVYRYWKLGVLVALVAALAILIPVYTRQKARVSHHGVWDDLRSQADLGSGVFAQIQGGTPEALAHFAEEHGDTPVGAWAKGLEVGALVKAEKLDEAERAAGELASAWPDHPLTRAAVFPGPDGTKHVLGDAIRTGKERLQAWEKEHAMLFSNPPLPADAPKVRLSTNKGAIVVGLYVDRAPKHSENFLKLCREGFYHGTKFHRVVRGSLIQGGDPNSASGDPETWGQGGPGNALEPESDPRLRHFKGALAAWKAPGDTNSHGSQFFLTTADQNQMDGQAVVFGIVLEGMPVIEAIESGAVVEDRPQDPATIESTEVLP